VYQFIAIDNDSSVIQVSRGLKVDRSSHRRAKNRDCLALISSKDLEISAINRYDRMLREQFAHPHQAQIGKIWLLVRISSGQTFELK
jgi:hypothetical protein